MLDVVVAFAAIGGFCLSLYNCALELFRRHPRGKVHVRKVTGEDGVDVGFAASAVNTGEATFTVCAFEMLDGKGKRIWATDMGGSDHLPKVVHPGEQCEVKRFGVDGEDSSVLGDVKRMVFVLATGKKLRSKKLPRGIDAVALFHLG